MSSTGGSLGPDRPLVFLVTDRITINGQGDSYKGQ